MNHPTLVSLASDADCADWHDRVQIALAIADQPVLKSLLTDCTPPIAQPHRIGSVSSAIGVPVVAAASPLAASPITIADGTIEFEELHCLLADSFPEFEQGVAEYSRLKGNRRGYLDLTRCEAESQTLGQMIPLSNAISLLAEAGFSAAQSREILNLPQDGWYKSWWYQADERGEFTVPFLRLIRCRHYADGKLTLQYKDFFAQDQPICFKSRSLKVLVEILPAAHQFAATLAKINLARQQLDMPQALLICDKISDLEARGFISQGISIYAAQEIALPVKANCLHCATAGCQMQGNPDSPVLLCQRFCLDGVRA
jgi:bacterioferritin-associated ferredoxin